MRILVIGAHGMLGQDFCKLLKENQNIVYEWDLPEHDITEAEQIINEIKELKPEIVCHFAAYTDVDKAEVETGKAFMVNVLGTWAISNACYKINKPLLYISTDYVFDGTKGTPYTEDDKPNPLNYYGKTKLLGEEVIKSHLKKFFIVRTARLFGTGGNNFVRKIIDLAKVQKSISVVHDQIGSPTYTKDLSLGIFKLVNSNHYGIYHITNQGSCSWYEFACEIKMQMKLDVQINPITSTEYSSKAARPKYSVLANAKYKKRFGEELRPWQAALQAYLNELKIF
jgi:dTDP-4-dehydrorhamnose reductase